jgi:uncharacterized protein YejL (UPF0352 family)
LEVIDVRAAEPIAEPTNKPQKHEAAIPLLLAVIGSVAGTLVSSAFSSSQNLALLGAALGAAIPPLVSWVSTGSQSELINTPQTRSNVSASWSHHRDTGSPDGREPV